jgi:hypothetical protein
MSETSRHTPTLDQAKTAAHPVVSGTSSADYADVPVSVGAAMTSQNSGRISQGDIERLFKEQTAQFATLLQKWPASSSIEDFVSVQWDPFQMNDQDFNASLLVAQLIGRFGKEPWLRSIWLHSMQELEEAMATIIARRTGRKRKEIDVKLCAATVTAAIRVFDEVMCLPDAVESNALTLPEANRSLAEAIRKASTLSFCDPVAA